jgi:hypothetical protein
VSTLPIGDLFQPVSGNRLRFGLKQRDTGGSERSEEAEWARVYGKLVGGDKRCPPIPQTPPIPPCQVLDVCYLLPLIKLRQVSDDFRGKSCAQRPVFNLNTPVP